MTVDPQLLSGLGAAASVFLASTGSALASAHGGIFAIRRGGNWKSFVPIVQAGVLSIYGLIVAIVIVGKLGGETDKVMSAAEGYRYLAAGLANGLGCWASGWGMAKFIAMLNDNGDMQQQQPAGATTGASASTTTPEAEQPLLPGSSSPKSDDDKQFRTLTMAMIFLEAIGLYGFIVAVALIWK